MDNIKGLIIGLSHKSIVDLPQKYRAFWPISHKSIVIIPHKSIVDNFFYSQTHGDKDGSQQLPQKYRDFRAVYYWLEKDHSYAASLLPYHAPQV